MAIDYPKWLSQVKMAVEETEAALADIQRQFAGGVLLAYFPEEGEDAYGTGQLFFERIRLEIQTAIGTLKSTDEDTIKGTDLRSQLFYDDLLKRQRKLFEALLQAIMLDRDGIWEANRAQHYLLHVHLVHDWEYYRHYNADLNESFGVVNDFAFDCKRDIEQRIAALPINPDLCLWAVPLNAQDLTPELLPGVKESAVTGAVLGASLGLLTGLGFANTFWTATMAALGTAVGIDRVTVKKSATPKAVAPRPRIKPQSANAMFLNVRNCDATELEKSALGLSYRTLFGFSSGQIHFTLSRFHAATANEWDLLQAIENTTLLCVSLTLRQSNLLERMSGASGAALQKLRDHFNAVLPNTIANAVLGESEVGDLVTVFTKENLGNFPGIITQKKFRGIDRFCAYEVKHALGGRLLWYGAPDVQLMVRSHKQGQFMDSAIEAGFAEENMRGNLPAVLHSLGQHAAGGSLFTGPMADHLPRLYFVQEYLSASQKP